MDVVPRTIKAPLRGVHRGSDLESQPEGTCFDALNVVGFDKGNGRARIAVSPGFVEFGDQSAVNLIANLNVTSTTTQERLLITAAGGNLYKWSGETPTSLGSGITTGRNVAWAPYLQDLFIANDSTPKVYRHSVPSLGNWTASSGSVPSGCPIICTWDNRIVLAGNPVHVWYMSRVGDPFDWLFASDDASSPVAATDIEGGQLGEPITALVPHNRQCLLISSANTIAVVRGNPTDGGIFERVSNVAGIVNKTAWCRSPQEVTYFITRKGLAMMPPGCGDYPTLISADVLPDSLLAIDGTTREAYLCYDVLNDLVHIHVTGVSPEYWFYDPKNSAFWPRTVPGTSILAMHRHDPSETADESGVLVGTAEGLMRLDNTAPLGGEVPAYIVLGPHTTGDLGQNVLLQKSQLKFASSTDDLDGLVDFYGGPDGEGAAALQGNRKHRSTIRNCMEGHWVYPRVSGGAHAVKITQVDTSKHWSFEQETDLLLPFGVERGQA